LFTVSAKMMYGSPVSIRAITSFWIQSERASTSPRFDPSLGDLSANVFAVAHGFA
jgi:hypothetical protein